MKTRTILVSMLLFLSSLAATALADAPSVTISRDGGGALLTWEGSGLLQFADNLSGPWTDDLRAVSPHRVSVAGGQRFFRVFYPVGFRSLLEPPRMAPGEPHRAPVSDIDGTITTQEFDGLFLFSGEFHLTAVDLRIKGRGLDFIWARRYRSRLGPNTAQGNRWDFSYNIFIQPRGPHVEVFDGNGRRDVFFRQPDGSYVADEFFREGRFDANGVFTLMFADKGVWEFHPLSAALAPGKLARSADRNGNALAFAYDAQGRLATVTDTLGRNVTLAYNGDGFIESVTDFIGRQVRYAYYRNGDSDGAFGDLKSVTSPPVTGTPTGNDFPAGKTPSYTYTQGFPDERDNHLLLTVTDPKQQTPVRLTYGPPIPPPPPPPPPGSSCTGCTIKKVTHGRPGEEIHFEYVPQTPAPSNGQAVIKVIVNDRVGNVSEHFYDAGNRLVLLRAYTGRAVPGQPTTETLNRPTNPLRTNDPPFFETRCEWNVDSLLTRAVFPNGNSVSNTYELAFDPGTARRFRGNLREHRQWPGSLGGDQAETVQRFEYANGFGIDGFAIVSMNSPPPGFPAFPFFVTRHVDGRGNVTLHTYDERGNRTNTLHRIPTTTEQWEYNSFGQVTAYVAPDNGSGHRRRDAFSYYTSGQQMGYLHQRIVDSDPMGLNLTTTCEHDAVGNVTRVVHPRGNETQIQINQINQIVLMRDVGGPLRSMAEYFYDANDNLVRVDVENRDETGALVSSNAFFTRLMEYEILNRLVRVCAEAGSFDVPRSPPQLDCAKLPASEFVTIEYEYDANRNLTLLRNGEASEGRQPDNTVRLLHDERDLLFQSIRAPGTPDASTDQFDYDGNGNLGRLARLDVITTKETEYLYDGYNRRTTATDAMGNVTLWHYDANGNAVSVRTDGETNDAPGAAGNIRLAETSFAYDAMDRLVRRDKAFFDTATQARIADGFSTTLFTYAGTSQLLAVTDDNHHTNRYAYDRANRLRVVTDPKTNTCDFEYDGAGNITTATAVDKSDLGNPDQSFTTRYAYDDLNRLIRVADNVSNSVQYAYDSRNNLVLRTDPLGFQTRAEFDGLDRPITILQAMSTNPPSVTNVNDIVIRRVWDDSSRLVQQTDDNTNTTTYVYDALNRLVREVLADGTERTTAYDVHDNVVTLRDANSNVVHFAYDLLDRPTNKSIVPGPGVSRNTTFERFAYDGLSRLVRAQNNDSLVEFHWDSMSNTEQELMLVGGVQTVARTHDGVGNVLTLTYPGGRRLTNTFDALDRLTGISDTGGVVASYKYIGPTRVERSDFANRTQTTYTYDGVTGVPNSPGDFGVQQLSHVRHEVVGAGTVIDERVFAWDRNQSRALRTQVVPSGLTHLYSYDAADRLARTLVMHPSSGIVRDTGYSLDGVGNRAVVTTDGTPAFYTLDPTAPQPADFQVNQYTTTPLDSRQYDANGNPTNLVARAARRLVFDYQNQLVQHTDVASGTVSTYAYDTLGRRIAKTIVPRVGPTTTNRYFWSAGGQASHHGVSGADMLHDFVNQANLANALLEERDGAGATLATFVCGAGGLVQMQRRTNEFFNHSDDLGNVFALTDTRGLVVERYEYGDFGAPQFFNASGVPISESAVGNPYLFNGLRYDFETGFYHKTKGYSVQVGWYKGRYFDPALGRFISRNQPDALGNALTFAGNNPWSHSQEYRPGTCAQTDYNFESPSTGDAQSDSSYRVKVKFPWLNSQNGAAVGTWKKVDGLTVEREVAEYGGGYSTVVKFRRNAAGGGVWNTGGDPRETVDYFTTPWWTSGPKSLQVISAGNDKQAIVITYFNPKELTIDKPVRWQKSQVRHRFFSIIDRTPLGPNEGEMFFGRGTFHGAGERARSSSISLTVNGAGLAGGHPDLYMNIWINQGEIPTVPSNQGWGKWKINPKRVNGYHYGDLYLNFWQARLGVAPFAPISIQPH